MTLFAKILWAGMGVATAVGVYTGRTGFFVPPPTKDPVSIREGSVGGHGGRTRVHYFRGGGVHHGK